MIDPGRFMAANGEGVVIPTRVLAWISRRARLDQLRVAVRGLGDDELDSVLLAVRLVVLNAGTSGPFATSPEVQRSSSWVSCSGAAAALGVTDRAIRMAAAEGRLTATKTAAGWQIDRGDLEHYRATRRRRR